MSSYVVNENTTQFGFRVIADASANRALGKLKKAFGFGSDDV